MHKYIEAYFKNFKFKHELKFFQKKIDFIYLDEKNRIHAIELKIKDWKSALYQIDTNQLFAHYAYLGIWHEHEKLVPKSIFRKFGFGLLSVNKENCDLLIKPKKSSILDKNLSTQIKTRIYEEYI